LFESAAKGNWTVQSDLDVFIGLGVDDGQRITDRMGEFGYLVGGNIEVFPYARCEWERMFANRHAMLLDVLEDGIVLFDRGAFAQLRATYQRWRATGELVCDGWGWRLARVRNRDQRTRSGDESGKG